MGYEEEPWDKMECSSPEETRFFVTLMMSGGDKEGDGYIPRENKKRGKEEASASDTSSEACSSEGTPKGKDKKWLSTRRKKKKQAQKNKNSEVCRKREK